MVFIVVSILHKLLTSPLVFQCVNKNLKAFKRGDSDTPKRVHYSNNQLVPIAFCYFVTAHEIGRIILTAVCFFHSIPVRFH